MTEKVQSRNKYHHPSVFHHGLVKLIVLNHLSSINITWETFMEKVATAPTTSPLVMHSTPSPSLSAQLMEVGFSSVKTQISNTPSVFEVTHTYDNGKIQVFSPKLLARK